MFVSIGSNIRPKYTGLPMVVWVQPKTGKERHGPRLKVQTTHGDKVEVDNWVTVTIEDAPKVIGKGLSNTDVIAVNTFIKKNKENLLKFWNDEIDPIEFTMAIQKI